MVLTGGELEHRHGLHQFVGLRFEAAGSSSHLLHQGRVLLRDLVHLRHRLAHLGHAG